MAFERLILNAVRIASLKEEIEPISKNKDKQIWALRKR